MRITLWVAALLVASTPALSHDTAYSYFTKGNDLVEFCEENDGVYGGACIGYVSGAIDAVSAIQASLHTALRCCSAVSREKLGRTTLTGS